MNLWINPNSSNFIIVHGFNDGVRRGGMIHLVTNSSKNNCTCCKIKKFPKPPIDHAFRMDGNHW